MATLEMIRDAKALGALAAFREIGAVCDLNHDGTVTAGLIACVKPGSEFLTQELTGEGVVREKIFILPRQANFAGAVRPGDTVAYPSGGSVHYTVRQVAMDELDALYYLTATQMASPVSL